MRATKASKDQEKTDQQKRGVKSREIIGILLLGFSVFSILSLYADTAGWIGLSLRKALQISFGDLAVMYGGLLFFLSLHIFRGRQWPPSPRRIFGLTLLILSITLVFHMLYHRGYQFPPQLAEEISY
ncbi:MAG: hypothetical protein GX956_04440, partial [Firmicutes bacterium]|nr:hypothetical protein [Bacillota bacterium]